MKLTLTSFVVFALLGCGGSGSPVTPNGYAGQWDGSFIGTPDKPDSGTINLTIKPDGSMVGYLDDTTLLVAANLTGKVDNAGKFTMHLVPIQSADAPFNTTGALVFSGDGTVLSIGFLDGDTGRLTH